MVRIDGQGDEVPIKLEKEENNSEEDEPPPRVASVSSYVQVKKLMSTTSLKKKRINEVAEFIKPMYEEQIKVLPNSWQPEDDSHTVFKDMILAAFQDESRKKLNHVCHDLAY